MVVGCCCWGFEVVVVVVVVCFEMKMWEQLSY